MALFLYLLHHSTEKKYLLQSVISLICSYRWICIVLLHAIVTNCCPAVVPASWNTCPTVHTPTWAILECYYDETTSYSINMRRNELGLRFGNFVDGQQTCEEPGRPT